MEGSVIGQYRVTKKLGEGGMGAVYAGEHALLGRKAAIKMLLPQLSQNQEIVQRFFNEARAATAIQDPGIVQIFDFGYHTDGSAYIVMEFLEGEPLDARLKRLGRLNVFDALRIMRQAASSLAAAHARGIIHRDLKPENIYLVADREVAGGERPKLLDFGIAKLTNDAESKVKTHTAAIMGTPMYMSPEQCRGAGTVDARSDVYALGCVLFHLIVGRTPFDGEGVGEIIASHLREPAPSPSQFVPGLPVEVDNLVARCLAKQPEQRFQSATELADAIGWLLGQTGQPMPASLQSAQFATPAQPTTLSGASGVMWNTGGGAPAIPQTGVGQTGAGGAPRRKTGLIVGVLGAVAVAAGLAIVLLGGSSGGGGTGAGPAPAAAQPPAGSGSVTPPGPGSGSLVASADAVDAGAALAPPPVEVDAGAAVPPPVEVDAGVAAAAPDPSHDCSRGKKWDPKKKKCVRASSSDKPPVETTQPAGGGEKPDLPAWKKCPKPVPGDTDCDGIPDER